MPSLDFTHAWPWLQWVIVVAAFLGFFGGVIRVVPGLWRGVSRFVSTINALSDLPDFIERTDDSIAKQNAQLDGIFHETHRNDGSSIKDSTVRLETLIEGIHARLDRVETGVAGLYGKVDELEASDTSTAEQLAEIEKTIPKPPHV